jgi:hypothetical protein
MAFITDAGDHYMMVQFKQHVMAALSNWNIALESQTDPNTGCTAEGYVFNMAFKTSVTDSSTPPFYDNFAIFFRTTEEVCSNGSNGSSGSSECMAATVEADPRQNDTYVFDATSFTAPGQEISR